MGIDKDKRQATEAAELRRQAEELLRAKRAEARPPRTEEEAQRLIHELQVYQIELEMQNEELRQTRDDLDATLEKFTDLYDFAPVGYLNLDRAGAIRKVNLTCSDLLGVERSLLVNRRLGHFLSAETRPVFHDFLDKVFESETRETCEAVILKERHSPLFVQIEAVAFESREECRVAIIDISERKRMENELQEAHDALERKVAERTRDLAQNVESLQNEIAEHKRAEEKILQLNRLYAVLSRTNQSIVKADDRDSLFQEICRVAVELGGFRMAWIGLVDEESGMVRPVASCGINEGYLDNIRISVREEPEGLEPTGRAIRDGSLCIASNIMNDPRFTPLRTAAEKRGYRSSASIPLKMNDKAIGALTMYSGEEDFFDWQLADLLQRMATDISFALDNLDRGARRREAERVLQDEIVERLRVSEELREKERLLILQSRQAAMGELIDNIAHQWRQPLNSLSLVVQFLRDTYHDGECSSEYMDETVEQIINLIMHMSRTIEDFRNFSRPDQEMKPFDLKETVSKTLILVGDSFKAQNIQVDIQAQEDLMVTGYPNEYSQVLLIILNNARDALTERNVASPRIEINLFREGKRAVATISDNAGGIPAALIDRIFEPYFTTKDAEKGSGIGLYMSKAIIERRLNGKISVLNTDQGAEFRIEV